MKKIALLLCLVMAVFALSACGNTAKETAEPTAAAQNAETAPAAEATDAPATQTAAKTDVELTVFNWYDYIDPAAIELFEQETGISVKYCNFTTNEEMYTKLEAGAGAYDVLFPSDYMIERMIQNDMLEELDVANMPNLANLIDRVKAPDYDP